ncbi:hypothetical protein GCM10028857_17890 [Salinarchaeum chitinilyticum]
MTRDRLRKFGSAPSVDRAVSTVLDAAVFLLLVSAAIGLLYTVPQSGTAPESDSDVAATSTTTLATTTATIEYAPAPDGDAGDGGATRTDRGTVAELLAETTVANADFDGEPFSRAPNHEAAVREVTRLAIASFDGDVEIQVRTHWRPLPGSGLRGGLVVGPSPPDDADVHAATVAVPIDAAPGTAPATPNWTLPVSDGDAGGENASSIAGESRATLQTIAAEGGCDTLARSIAVRTIGAVFPPERTDAALLAGGDVTAATEQRYATAGSAAGLDAGIVPDDAGARTRNSLLVQALTDRIEPTACEGYADTAAAANRAAPTTVSVSIRTWSP